MGDKYFLLWSKSQDALHIEPIERTMGINAEHFARNRQANDYMPIAIGTQEQIDAVADVCRKAMLERKA